MWYDGTMDQSHLLGEDPFDPADYAAQWLDAVLTDVEADQHDDLELLAFDDDEVASRMESFVFDDQRAPSEDEIQAVMIEAERRLGLR